MRFLFFAFLCMLAAAPLVRAKDKPPATYAIPLPPKSDFSSLEWLTGEWKGTTTGRGTHGDIHLAVEFTLDRRFMILREELTLPATATVPATSEAWMGVLSGSRSGATFLLRMYSSTGFILRYRVTVDGPEIHFDPEGGEQSPPGWLFRRTMERFGTVDLNETVQVAPPRKAFFDYYTATLTRVPNP